jgi:hypothetical protein
MPPGDPNRLPLNKWKLNGKVLISGSVPVADHKPDRFEAAILVLAPAMTGISCRGALNDAY